MLNKRSTALIYAARVADIWLHPIAFLRGKRRRPKTFDDLRALGLLAGHRDGRPEMLSRPLDRGMCLNHGYVTDRCCALWEAAPATTYLRDAIATGLNDRHADIANLVGDFLTEATHEVERLADALDEWRPMLKAWAKGKGPSSKQVAETLTATTHTPRADQTDPVEFPVNHFPECNDRCNADGHYLIGDSILAYPGRTSFLDVTRYADAIVECSDCDNTLLVSPHTPLPTVEHHADGSHTWSQG